MKIQRRFGEIPDMEEVLPIERISVYHKHQGMEDVDQVTWSDLSMDQVFQRIDQCDSAAGEAVLTTCCTVQITGRRSGKTC